MYTIRQNTRLFHGTRGDLAADAILERPNFFGDEAMAAMFFALDFQRHHEAGGIVHSYKASKDIQVIALDHPATLVWLKNTIGASPEFWKRFQIAFPEANVGATEVTRFFNARNDRYVLSELCSLFSHAQFPFHGTGTMEMSINHALPQRAVHRWYTGLCHGNHF